jgi:hypothetical protein
MKAPPVHLTDKTRELLRLFAADPVMAGAFDNYAASQTTVSNALFVVSRLADHEWDIMERKYRAAG